MENFIDNQSRFNVILHKIINLDKKNHAYMLVSNDSKLLEESSILFAKALICPKKFSKNCNLCNICHRIDNNEFSELKIISPVNNIIKKQEILDLRTQFQTMSIEGKNMVYIINNAEYLGSSAANSILKFLEEPESNVIGIFTTCNLSLVMETIKSRCQIIKLNDNNLQYGIDYIKKSCNCDDEIIDKAINFVNNVENNITQTVTNNINDIIDSIDGKEKLTSFMNVIMHIYVDKLNNIILNKTKYFIDKDNFDKIVLKDKEKTINKISLVLDYIEKINYNVNVLLLLSSFVIEIGEINNDKSNWSKI